MLNENNGLIQENQVWRLTNSSIGIPPKIKDIILQRIAVLGRNHRSLLDVAAVLGEKFDPTILAEILAQDPLEVIKTLDIIAKDTSLVCCEGELFRFDHARTRDALYDDISPALKRSYHAKVAQKLEYRGGKLPLADLAYQYSQAGNTQKATKYALAAGQIYH
jgi:predicted ATPase